MKVSQLIKLLQQSIVDYDDLDVEVYKQTGPDSYLYFPVLNVAMVRRPRNRRIIEIETE